MASDFLAIRDELRALERKVRFLHTKLGADADWKPLRAIAASIGDFAEMLPVYGSFVQLIEAAHGTDPNAKP